MYKHSPEKRFEGVFLLVETGCELVAVGIWLRRVLVVNNSSLEGGCFLRRTANSVRILSSQSGGPRVIILLPKLLRKVVGLSTTTRVPRLALLGIMQYSKSVDIVESISRHNIGYHL